MLLAVDCGNSYTSFGLFQEENLRFHWRLATDSGRSSEEYAVFLESLFARAGENPKEVRAIAVANVVPGMESILQELGSFLFGRSVLDLSDCISALGIRILVPQPRQVGIDRVMNGLAVAARGIVPAIVVDFGTATTFDLIDMQGNYAGGVIAPGVKLSLEVLHRSTARLPKVCIGRPARVIGTDTSGALQSGIFWGYVGLVEGILERMQKERETRRSDDIKARIVITGGLAGIFAHTISDVHAYVPNLTLEGIRLAFSRIRAGRAEDTRHA